IWHRHKLERQLAYLNENPAMVLVGSAVVTFSAKAHDLSELPIDPAAMKAYSALDFLSYFTMFPSTYLVRREVAVRVNFVEGMRVGEDMIYLAQVRALGGVSGVPEPLVRRRLHRDQVTDGIPSSVVMTDRIQWAMA